MSTAVTTPGLVLLVIFLIMVGEAALAASNERRLRARGAVEPAGDVYATMRWAYPACFVALAVEGLLTGPAPPAVMAWGLGVFGVAKALKVWAISTLGDRWTFRVLVLRDAPLVVRGPYAFLRHPNYVAVLGELAGAALVMWAPVMGTVAIFGFGSLMLRRIAIEDRALGRQ